MGRRGDAVLDTVIVAGLSGLVVVASLVMGAMMRLFPSTGIFAGTNVLLVGKLITQLPYRAGTDDRYVGDAHNVVYLMLAAGEFNGWAALRDTNRCLSAVMQMATLFPLLVLYPRYLVYLKGLSPHPPAWEERDFTRKWTRRAGIVCFILMDLCLFNAHFYVCLAAVFACYFFVEPLPLAHGRYPVAESLLLILWLVLSVVVLVEAVLLVGPDAASITALVFSAILFALATLRVSIRIADACHRPHA